MSVVSRWDIQKSEQIKKSHEEYKNHPDYKAIAKEAKKRGYKPAPLWMCLADSRYIDVIYKWRGGCWVRLEYIEDQQYRTSSL